MDIASLSPSCKGNVFQLIRFSVQNQARFLDYLWLMILLYRFSIALYVAAIRIASLFNAKAALWVKGRKDWNLRLKNSGVSGHPVILFHCASLGEFEMARPLMEWVKRERPAYKIVLSFFSPSGYEVRKDYALADYVCYLPADTPSNARNFAELLRPDIVVYAKYEFWHYFIQAFKTNGARQYAVSSVFRESHRFFKWYGGFFRKDLMCLDRIFVQDSHSKDLLNTIGIESEVAGDTRFDRVAVLAEQAIDFPEIRNFAAGRRIIIAGSSWSPEEERITRVINDNRLKNVCWIFAPHDISPAHLSNLEEELQVRHVRYSKFQPELDASVMIIDNIGMLMSLYRLADVAIIGGGFTGKLHNILEPAAFGVPVLFGPKHHRFHEAREMITAGGAIEFNHDLAERLDVLFKDQWQLQSMSNSARKFVQQHIGATKKIVESVFN
ncbi:MAG: 3-deoxy-D-manno-octulosonic acid transferase [Flavobacteriales bacterium]